MNKLIVLALLVFPIFSFANTNCSETQSFADVSTLIENINSNNFNLVLLNSQLNQYGRCKVSYANKYILQVVENGVIIAEVTSGSHRTITENLVAALSENICFPTN